MNFSDYIGALNNLERNAQGKPMILEREYPASFVGFMVARFKEQIKKRKDIYIDAYLENFREHEANPFVRVREPFRAFGIKIQAKKDNERRKELANVCVKVAGCEYLRDDDWFKEKEKLMGNIDKKDIFYKRFEWLKDARDKIPEGKEECIKLAQENPRLFAKYVMDLEREKHLFIEMSETRECELSGKQPKSVHETLSKLQDSLDGRIRNNQSTKVISNVMQGKILDKL